MIKSQFQTKTKINPIDYQNLKHIVEHLWILPQAIWFLQPVDHAKLNIPDYPVIITHPMDLGTIKQRLQYNQYRFIEVCLEDIQLVWNNCKTYNSKQHIIYHECLKIEKIFHKMIKNYFPQLKKTYGNYKNHDKNTNFEEESSQSSSKKEQIKRINKKGKITKIAKDNKMQEEKEKNLTDLTDLRNIFIELIPKCSPKQVGIIVQIIKDFSFNAINFDENGLQKVNLQAVGQSLMKRLIDQLQIWDIKKQI